MNKIRVYQLAKELDLSNKDLIDQLSKMNIEAHNHMGALEDKDVDRVREALKHSEDQDKEAKKIVNVAIKQSVRHVAHGIHPPGVKDKHPLDEHKHDAPVELKVTVLEEAKRPSKTTGTKAKSKPKTETEPAAKQDIAEKSKRIPAAQAAALKQEEQKSMAKAQHVEQSPPEQKVIKEVVDSSQKESAVVAHVSSETKEVANSVIAPVQVTKTVEPAIEKVSIPKVTESAADVNKAEPKHEAKDKTHTKSPETKEAKPVVAKEPTVSAEQPATSTQVSAEVKKEETEPKAPKPDYRIATQRAREAAAAAEAAAKRNEARAAAPQGEPRPDYRTATRDANRPDYRTATRDANRPDYRTPPTLNADGSKPDYRTATRDANRPDYRTASQGQGGQRPYTPRPAGSTPYGNRPAGSTGGYGDKKPGFGGAGAGNKDRNYGSATGRPKKAIPGAKSDVEVIPYADRASISGQAKNSKSVHEKKPIDSKSVDKRKTTVAPRSMQRTEVRRNKTYKRQKQNKNREIETQIEEQQLQVVENLVKVTESMTVAALAVAIDKNPTDIILKLMNMGIMATINKDLDLTTLEILAADLDFTIEIVEPEVDEDIEAYDYEDEAENLVKRPPVVTVMGHVDHGKTSLLDAIRNTKITTGEAGGITQHIGASEVVLNGEKIVFLDTPGHEAFTTLRARGAQVTDIAILVVAADDGVMPQTMEAIDHALAAKVPIIIAINKIDKANANPDRVRQELADYGLLVEDWGGNIVSCEVSALKGQGIDTLLEMVLLVAEIQDLKANPNRAASGTIIEAKVEKGRGTVATVLVQNGTLNIGDTFVVGPTFGKVKAMYDDTGRNTKAVYPSSAVEITGLNEIPNAGDKFFVVDNEKTARTIAEKRAILARESSMNTTPNHVTLEDLFSQIQQGNMKDLNIIVKADVHGSVEALKSSLLRLTNEEVRVNVIHASVGTITESDVLLASASNAIIIGFNVRPISVVSQMADKEKVDIKTYRIIYEAMNDVEAAMKGMLDPIYKEVVIGKVEVRALFKVPNIGVIAGAYVLEGKVTRNSSLRLVREGIIIHEGKVSSLKRFKDDAKEVLTNFECGIGIENYNDLREGDIIESFINEEVKR